MNFVAPRNIYLNNLTFNRDKIALFINPSQFKQQQKLPNKGLTLAELLMAAAIFAFAMSGIIYMFINSAFLDQANRNKSIAAAHAEFVMENIMEYMRLGTLSSLQTQIQAGTWHWDSSTAPSIGSYLGCTSPYVYPCVLDSESITTTINSSQTNYFDITVTASWKDRAQANARTLALRTFIAKR